jgi:NAD-dependent dihydropyrimidine dehydrogenase PreA subunit
MIREIVRVDEAKCDGCGVCVPTCHEGAIEIIDGKARLVADKLCDGLGACLAHCPQGAITVERREADAFDEAAVAAHLDNANATPAKPAAPPPPAKHHHHGGCPGAKLMRFDQPPATPADPHAPESESPRSELSHWPVQLRLLPPGAPVLRGASLLIAADCVPVTMADFHQRLLRGRAVLIGCPKFDDLPGDVAKLTEMIRANGLKEIVVARMEVPCCMGIVLAAQEARDRAGVDIPLTGIVVGTRGQILRSTRLPAARCPAGRATPSPQNVQTTS